MSSTDMTTPTPTPTPEPAPEPAPVKKKRVGKKLTEKQKTDLTKHMEKMKKGGMDSKEMKSHRMKLMSKMRKDEKVTATKAHKMVMAS